MVLEARVCENCSSINIVKNGKNATGQQRYKCKDCGVTRVLDSLHKVDQVDLASKVIVSEVVGDSCCPTCAGKWVNASVSSPPTACKIR